MTNDLSNGVCEVGASAEKIQSVTVDERSPNFGMGSADLADLADLAI